MGDKEFSAFDYIRKHYGVPAKQGQRIKYTGEYPPLFGTITGARGGHIRVVMDGEKHSGLFHPTWSIEYLKEEKPRRAIADCPWCRTHGTTELHYLHYPTVLCVRCEECGAQGPTSETKPSAIRAWNNWREA